MTVQKQLSMLVGFIAFLSACTLCQDTEPNAQLGSETSVSNAYLKMGELRLINNDWGSSALDCDAHYKIFINQDGSFGWDFSRDECGGGGSYPDFPEVEFGVHPFGIHPDSTRGTLDYSSTTLLPIQIKDVVSASIAVDNLRIVMDRTGSWNITFEMWLSEEHPVTAGNPTPYSELMTFWGWQEWRYPCLVDGYLQTGNKSYRLCHQSDNWGGWRYYQFRAHDGPRTYFDETIDVKATLDWLVNNAGHSRDLWITRLEIGSEIDDGTRGTVTIDNLTFEVNGESRSAEFYDSSPVNESSMKEQDLALRKQDIGIFPARALVEIVDLQGARSILRTGADPMTAAQLSRNLSPGMYLMFVVDDDGLSLTKPVVVPVTR